MSQQYSSKNLVVIFVCTGNICRSPMAEGILKDIVIDMVEKNHTILPIEVLSAGIFAENGLPASRYSREVADRYGITLEFHRSRQITDSLAHYADLILTMEYVHTEYIRQLWPDIGYVDELMHFGRSVGSIELCDGIHDPIGQGIDVYEKMYAELRFEIERVSENIISLARDKYRAK